MSTFNLKPILGDKNIKSLFKFIWFPVCLFLGCFSFVGYTVYKEYALNSTLVEKALEGNTYAIKILAKYEKPWKLDERIVLSALEGNQYALEVLKIGQEPTAL